VENNTEVLVFVTYKENSQGCWATTSRLKTAVETNQRDIWTAALDCVPINNLQQVSSQLPYAALPMRIWTLVSISNHEIEVVDGQGR
jgi:hypothetical protein